MARATAARFALAAALVAGAVSSAAALAGSDPELEARRLQQEKTRLQALADLARGDEFYLVLDVAGAELRLMLKGALLHSWPVSAIEVGSPRRLFVPRDVPQGWRGRIWDGGWLDPVRELERVEVAVPESPDDVEPIEPLDAEKAIPAPSRYFVRYDGGLALEIVGGDGEPGGGILARIGRSWGDAVSAVAGPAALRVRLVFPPADAKAIYRSLPQPIRLLVL